MLARILGMLRDSASAEVTQCSWECVSPQGFLNPINLPLSPRNLSAFFGLLASLFIPASMPVQLFLFVSILPCEYSSGP